MIKFWTDERIAFLRDMVAAGHSSGQIGAVMGCSRNAVIGKIHRLGIHGNHGAKTSHGRVQQSRLARAQLLKSASVLGIDVDLPRPKPANLWKRRTSPIPIPAEDIGPYANPQPDDKARKSLLDVEPGDCRWPVGDPRDENFGFCALPKQIGSSYCPHHCRVAFTSPTPNRAISPANAKKREYA